MGRIRILDILPSIILHCNNWRCWEMKIKSGFSIQSFSLARFESGGVTVSVKTAGSKMIDITVKDSTKKDGVNTIELPVSEACRLYNLLLKALAVCPEALTQ